jgi:hypothetical protein
MRGLELDMLAKIVLVVIVVLVAVGILQTTSAVPLEKYLGIQPIEGVAGELTWDIFPEENPFGKTSLEIEHLCDNGNCISTGDTWQPSELGCVIATDIFEDFSVKGYLGSRVGQEGANCFLHYILPKGRRQEYCVINYGLFKLEDTNTAPPSWWEDDVLSPLGCGVCDQVNFDEVCINKNLEKRQVGASDFCDGTFGHPEEGAITFGNCICAGGPRHDMGNLAAWEAQCDGYINAWGTLLDCENDGLSDTCDNDEDLLMWVSDSNPYITYPIKDQFSDDRSNTNLVEKNQLHMYGVIWKPKDDIDKTKFEQEYKVLFVRISESGGLLTDFDFIVEYLDYNDNNIFRFNGLGNFERLPRIIINATVTPTATIGVTALINNIENVGWSGETDVETQTCGDATSCLRSEISDTEEKCAQTDFVSIPTDAFLSLEKIILKTNVPDAENGELVAGTQYIVQITNWFNEYTRCKGTWDWLCTDTPCYNKFDRTISIYQV